MTRSDRSLVHLDAAADGIATIAVDDGKANARSPATLGALDDAVAKAETAGRPVVLAGRPGTFSAGFA